MYKPLRVYRESGKLTFKSKEYSVRVFDNFQVPHLVIEGEGLAVILRMEKPQYWFTTYVSSSFAITDITSMKDMRAIPGFAEALNNFLKSKDKDTGLTYWEKTVRNWNILNPDHRISEGTPAPDYTKAVLDPDQLRKWGVRLDELIKNAEARIPKYELAWYTLYGYDVGCLKQYYKEGYRIVGTISCDSPVVLMERPAVQIHEIVEEEFL